MFVAGRAVVEDTEPWSVAVSGAVHAALVIALIAMPVARRLADSDEVDSVAVRILSPAQFRQAVSPPAPALPAPRNGQPPPSVQAALPVPAAPAQPQQPPADAMIRPATLLSARTLADPRSRRALADLATFSAEERLVQICNIEAMDQIGVFRKEFRPDRVTPYATAPTTIQGRSVQADGAAFRSGRGW